MKCQQSSPPVSSTLAHGRSLTSLGMCLLNLSNVACPQLAVTNNNQQCSFYTPPVLFAFCNSLVLNHTTVTIPQYSSVFLSIPQYITVYHSIPQYITVYHSISQYITVYHSISQHTTVDHSIPQYIINMCFLHQAVVLMKTASVTHGHSTSTHCDGSWST